MRSALTIAGGLLALLLVWFAIWFVMMRPHVARIEASLKYQNEQQKIYGAFKPILNIKYDDVYATGFPFRFEVAVVRPTLSMIYVNETYAVSFPQVTLSSSDSALGRYRVNVPATIEAFYAKDGGVPEHYTATARPVPDLLLSAQAADVKCGPLTGKACSPVAADAPIVSYAVGLPKAIQLHMVLNGKTRDVHFPIAPVEIKLPIFRTIPNDLSTPLEIFVNILREGLVFNTPSET